MKARWEKKIGKVRCTNQRKGFVGLAGAVGKLVMRCGIDGGVVEEGELVEVVRVEAGVEGAARLRTVLWGTVGVCMEEDEVLTIGSGSSDSGSSS